MVQKKSTQKAKVKTVPTVDVLLKSAKKPNKSTILSNGYKNTKSKSAYKKILEKNKNVELVETTSKISEEEPSVDEKTIMSKKETLCSETLKATSVEPSKLQNKNIVIKAENSSPETETNVKSEDKTKLVLQATTSRKRHLPSEPDELKTTTKKKPLSKSKTKAKKQKIVLEVPSLKSISGKVFVVGENDVGQLGLDEDVDSKEKPFLLDIPYSIIDVAAGGMHSVCLTENGEVITFGCNDEGALGRITSEEEERIPRNVDIPEKIVQISAGDSHSAALAESGQVYLWGNFRNGEGQMGLTPDGKKQLGPVKILNGITIVKIASGGDHLACLSSEGIVYTCGCGEQGQLGRLSSRFCHNGGRKGLATLLEPATVNISAGILFNNVWTESYATFLRAQETGSIYTFGLNNYNQLGYKNKNNDQQCQMKFFPEAISSFNNKSWQQITGGQHHTLALDSEGLVYALGRKDYGRLGLGQDCTDKSEPTLISALQEAKCKSISCGNCVSFSITEQGSLFSWGMGSSQLGHGNDEDIHVPRLIKGDLLNMYEVHKVSGGGQHALILACSKTSAKNKKT